MKRKYCATHVVATAGTCTHKTGMDAHGCTLLPNTHVHKVTSKHTHPAAPPVITIPPNRSPHALRKWCRGNHFHMCQNVCGGGCVATGRTVTNPAPAPLNTEHSWGRSVNTMMCVAGECVRQERTRGHSCRAVKPAAIVSTVLGLGAPSGGSGQASSTAALEGKTWSKVGAVMRVSAAEGAVVAVVVVSRSRRPVGAAGNGGAAVAAALLAAAIVVCRGASAPSAALR